MNLKESYSTDRLLLRPTTLDDVELFYQMYNSPKWLQYIGDRNIKTLGDATQYMTEKVLPPYEQNGYGSYTIIRHDDQVKVGSCGIYHREGLSHADIGYALLPDHEGNGYAYEASAKLLELAEHSFHLTTINAITSKENLASQKILTKLGLKQTGTVTLPNDDEELFLYQITF